AFAIEKTFDDAIHAVDFVLGRAVWRQAIHHVAKRMKQHIVLERERGKLASDLAEVTVLGLEFDGGDGPDLPGRSHAGCAAQLLEMTRVRDLDANARILRFLVEQLE